MAVRVIARAGRARAVSLTRPLVGWSYDAPSSMLRLIAGGHGRARWVVRTTIQAQCVTANTATTVSSHQPTTPSPARPRLL